MKLVTCVGLCAFFPDSLTCQLGSLGKPGRLGSKQSEHVCLINRMTSTKEGKYYTFVINILTFSFKNKTLITN